MWCWKVLREDLPALDGRREEPRRPEDGAKPDEEWAEGSGAGDGDMLPASISSNRYSVVCWSVES